MAGKQAQRAAAVGVVEHGNSAVLVTLAPSHELLDRRYVDLTHDLPTHPYHHEGSWSIGRYVNSAWARAISLSDAIALVERVHVAADQGARESLGQMATTVGVPIARIAIRKCPKLPATIEKRITDTRAANVADSVVYRQALASAAESLGWSVHWYDRKHVFREAGAVMGCEDINAFLSAMGRSIGPPWQARHKLAAAAAIATAQVSA